MDLPKAHCTPLTSRYYIVLLCILCTAMFANAADLENQDDSVTMLKALSLEDLMNVEITTVSKKKEKHREAAAAVFVLTSEDIRRSGATSVADALRLVPGLSVAKLDANKWAITSRGFNDRFANKLLVLIDGISVYTPLFAGVFWDERDIMIEDIDRIEVIRGPGGTLWGSNAVNGVINIITKKSQDTQGALLSLTGGTEEKFYGTFRYGDKLRDDIYYRFYLKYFDRDEGVFASGKNASDDWSILSVGFRLDWDVSDQDSLTFQGELHDGNAGLTSDLVVRYPPYNIRIDDHSGLSGGNILLKWDHVFSETSDFSIKLYHDGTDRHDTPSGDDRNSTDFEFQHHTFLGKRHEIIWGTGYRYMQHVADQTPYVSLKPKSRNDDLFSAFLQDKISFLEDRLHLTLGAKLEHNDYTGFEFQPNIRVAWVPNDKHAWWASISRAVRIPSRAESDVRITAIAFPGIIVTNIGNPDINAENLTAYEVGYRVRPIERLAFDVTAFYNDYNDLRTIEMGLPFLEIFPLLPHINVPFYGNNNMEASTYGIELTTDWQPTQSWRIRASYTFLKVDLDQHQRTLDIISGSTEGNSPRNQFVVESRLNLPHNIEFDTTLKYVDNLPSMGIDSYFGLDTRLAWHPKDNIELAIVGQNLLEDHHEEYSSIFLGTVPSEVERSVYGKITFQF